MTQITKYLHFPPKKIAHIKRDCPKVILFQKTPPSLRATSFFPYLKGSIPNGGGSLKNDFLDSPFFLLKKNKGAYLPMITQEKPMTESFPLGKHSPLQKITSASYGKDNSPSPYAYATPARK